MNIFEYATRNQIRFVSSKGLLTTEDLWQLPLTSKTGFDLDNVAKMANNALKALTEESFVATKPKAGKEAAETALEVVKHVIAVKIAENEAMRNAADRKAKKDMLLEVLARKQAGALETMTVEEIQAQLAAL
jgi:DNA gyrase/topoisomerase IV subunit A